MKLKQKWLAVIGSAIVMMSLVFSLAATPLAAGSDQPGAAEQEKSARPENNDSDQLSGWEQEKSARPENSDSDQLNAWEQEKSAQPENSDSDQLSVWEQEKSAQPENNDPDKLNAWEPEKSAQPENKWSAHTTIHIRRAATSAPTGLSPAQIRSAYNLPLTGGSGTIAIVDAFDDPTALNDLAIFSKQFGLSSPNFEKHMMATGIKVDSGWALEASLDVQWAHAIAPNAKILLVEAKSANSPDLLAAINYARNLADVVAISMSWCGSEFSTEAGYDSYFTSSYGAIFFASSGDSGAGVSWPAVSPNVVGVGGTRLTFNSNGAVASETAWSGSGGGVSVYEPAPSFQVAYGVSGTKGKRAVPDVSYNADPYSGVSIYDSTAYSGASGWWQVGGTSAGAPQWAAIQSLGLSTSNTNFYRDAKLASYSSYLRDITAGSNGNSATPGYDLVTGLGSPLTTSYTPVTTPDFTLSVSPATQTILAGNPTSYAITINPLNSFAGNVALSLGGLPAGTTGAFTSTPATTSASLSVTTAATTPAGTYGLTITGVSGNLTRTTNVTLIVTAPSFSLSVSPASRTIARGSSTSYAVVIAPKGNFSGNVSLSVSGLPSQSSGTFSPNPATGSSTLTITTSSKTPTGTYKLTITGTGSGLKSSITVTLVITAVATKVRGN